VAPVGFKDRVIGEIEALRQQGSYTTSPILSGPQGPHITVDGRSFINLACNNYLGFANDPVVIQAAKDALNRYGFGLGTGRHICSMEVHRDLEKRLAEFKRRESAIVFQTGYDTNLSAISVLTGEGDLIISDELNHASIVDGCRLSRAERRIYKHKDLDDLKRHLRDRQGDRTTFVVTDGVFSMEGDIAPLPEIVELAEEYGAEVYVDDAHGDGVLGERGSGIVEHFNLHGRILIEMGTLSKAFGGVGGYVASGKEIVEYLFQRSRPFVFSTGHLPPMVAAGLVAAIVLLESQPQRLKKLWSNASHFRRGLQQIGFNTGSSATPIIPIIIGKSETAATLRRELLAAGIYVQAFSYPVVPRGAARVRCIVSAAHEEKDLDEALGAFNTVGRKIGLI